ncbi:MAG: peptidoglycan recognition protein family protein, partial [Planctomycetota bacterium]
MRLDFLANAFRAAGLTVVEEPDWETRGADWDPKGVMWHHTAPPVPYPVGNLYLTKSPSGIYRIKCNWNTKPTGVIHVIASGACNYSSGSGSGVVLAETMADIAPTGTARARGLPDTIGGNRHYINDEMDHRGDGGPVPVAQYHASMLAKAVVCEELGFSQRKVIGHAEFTRRKIDPRANGKLAHAFMEQG